MAGRMYLGNQMVSPVIMSKTFNVDGSALLGTVDENGVLVKDNNDINIVYKGVKEISSFNTRSLFNGDNRVKSVGFPDLETVSVTLEASFKNCQITEANFPKLKTVSGNNALTYFFLNCPITSVSMPELETAYGDLALAGMFRNTLVESVSLPKLKRAVGFQVMSGMFAYCPNLKSAYLPALEEIDSGGGASFLFVGCSLLETVDLHSLSLIGEAGLAGFFMYCVSLKNVDLPNVIEIKDYGMSECFSGSGIESLTLPELVKISSDETFYYMFSGCESLTYVSFPKLVTIEYTGGNIDCFNHMLDGCSNVTVHFNADLEDVIGSWSDVLSGFGGTNTTVLFDLNGCTIDVSVVGTSDYDIYVGGKLKTSPFITGSTPKEYVVYDETNDKLYFGMLENLVVGETNYFTVDFTQLTNKVLLNVGQSGLNVTITYNGITYPTTDEGNGSYSFYTNADNKTFTIAVPETATTRVYSGDVTIESGVNTYTITPTPKGWEAYTRPNIWSDGTMGGDRFAVTSSGCYSTAENRQAYNAVNGNTTTSYYWYSTNITNPIYYFYNPKEIKLTSLSFRWTSKNYRATQVVVDGSNDYENWTNIGTYALDNATTATATINSNTPYNYYRLTFTKGGTYIRLVDLGITGTEYK